MDATQVRTWLEAYRRAWEGRDPEAAAPLFDPRATYQWGPFEEPLRGRGAIRDRWAQATSEQQDVRFGSEVLAVTEDRALARRWCSLDSAGRRVRLEGVFDFTLTEGGECSRFREWWNVLEGT